MNYNCSQPFYYQSSSIGCHDANGRGQWNQYVPPFPPQPRIHLNPAFYRPASVQPATNPVTTSKVIINPKFFPGISHDRKKEQTEAVSVQVPVKPPVTAPVPAPEPARSPSGRQQPQNRYTWKKLEAVQSNSRPAKSPKAIKSRYKLVKLQANRLKSPVTGSPKQIVPAPVMTSTPLSSSVVRSRFKVDNRKVPAKRNKSVKSPKVVQTKYKLIRKVRSPVKRLSLSGHSSSSRPTPRKTRPPVAVTIPRRSSFSNFKSPLTPKCRAVLRWSSGGQRVVTAKLNTKLTRAAMSVRNAIRKKTSQLGKRESSKKRQRYYEDQVKPVKGVEEDLTHQDVEIGPKPSTGGRDRTPLGDLPSFITL